MGRSFPKLTGSIAEGRRERFLRIAFAASAGGGGLASGWLETTGSGAAKILLLGFETEGAAFGILDIIEEEGIFEEEEGCDNFDVDGLGLGFWNGRGSFKGWWEGTVGVERDIFGWVGFRTEARRGYMLMGLRFGRGAKLKRRSLCLGTVALRLLSMTLSTVNLSIPELVCWLDCCCCSKRMGCLLRIESEALIDVESRSKSRVFLTLSLSSASSSTLDSNPFLTVEYVGG